MNLPFVSICTPTFNRRPFIPYLIKCIQHQTYPLDKIEWVIVDDGTDCIEDLIQGLSWVKYFYYANQHMTMGYKRNLIHSKCTGDILINMDDDDYYPISRISHAVDELLKNPTFLIAGSSQMHIYYGEDKVIYSAGPYKFNHATAATFAFKRKLLEYTKYDNESLFAEEPIFLKNYSIPLLQLNSLKTILVISHTHSSCNKQELRDNLEQCMMIKTDIKIADIIPESDNMLSFYASEISQILTEYTDGDLKNKPAIYEALQERNNKRMLSTDNSSINNSSINNSSINNSNHNNNTKYEQITCEYEKKLSDKNIIISKLMIRIKELEEKLK